MSNEKNSISAVAMKLPTFWPERAKVWVFQAEAQFTLKGIVADETQYYYILAALDQDAATQIIDLLEKPSASDKYQAIRKRLLTTFSLDKARRADLLLEIVGLGDNTPSQLMDSMLTLLGNHLPCFLFQGICLRYQPSEIRSNMEAESTDQIYYPRAFSA